MNSSKPSGLRGLLLLGSFTVFFLVIAILLTKLESISPSSQSGAGEPSLFALATQPITGTFQPTDPAYPPPTVDPPYPPPNSSPIQRPITIATQTAIVLATIEAHCVRNLPRFTELPPTQQAFFEAKLRKCVKLALGPTPTHDPHPKTPTPAPTSPTPMLSRRPAGAGILTRISAPGPMSPSIYGMTSHWIVEADGKPVITVYAGAQVSDGAKPLEKPLPGFVMVEDETSGQMEAKFYDVPVKEAGRLEIVDAQGMELVLLAENGQIFVFDVVSRQFTATREGPFQRNAGAGVLVLDSQAPVSAEGYVWTNYWYEDKDGQRITVLAGGEGKNWGGPPVLMVVVTALSDQAVVSREVYHPPSLYDQGGPAMIFDVEGERLKIIVNYRELILFDLNSRDFIRLWR